MSHLPFDDAVRRWALQRAQDVGEVYTADLMRRFKLPMGSAAKRLVSLRANGLLVVGDVAVHGRISNEITDDGRTCLLHSGRPAVKRWDCVALCRALGEGITL